MLRSRLRGLGLLAVVGATIAPSVAQARQDAVSWETITTSHRIVLDGAPLAYTARAGFLPIRENYAGELRARMFFVSYTVRPRPGAPARPLTFLWNGGPGSNAALVHLLGFGPKRLNTGDTLPTSTFDTQRKWSDNQETWLGVSDLVFIDPIGTGYSRPARVEYGADFYQTVGDIESVAEFIRVYITRYDGWDSPIVLAGESYGVTRAAGVAEALERREMRVSGVILICGGVPFGQPRPPQTLSTALAVPGMTAAAFYHRRLARELQANLDATLRKAEGWAENVYAPALARRDALTPAERETILSQLSSFVGIPVGALDSANLAVDRQRYSTQLLDAEGLQFGNYDTRMTRPRDPPGTPYDPEQDPSLKYVLNPVGVLRYLRNELKVDQDLRYQGPFGGGYPPPAGPRGDWMSVRWNFGQAPGQGGGSPPSPLLKRAMEINPALTVFVAQGLYDSGGCLPSLRAVRLLEPPLAGRVTAACYLGGHSFYTDKEPRAKLRQDFTRFVQDIRTRQADAAR